MEAERTYYPGVPCVHCGKFVGRDGHFNEEFFEMSDELASLDGECARCLNRESDTREADNG